jgi:hypothetical protein
LPRKTEGERKVTIAAHLSESQKNEMEQLIRGWDVNMALVGRRLIQYLLSDKTNLLELLRKYHAEATVRELKIKTFESRTYRVNIRLSREEKQKLILLAEEGFFLPGEIARILMELFIVGIIRKSDIWE